MLNGNDGIAAEEYFLHAASLALGLRIISDIADEAPGTIRKTIENTEEAEKTDFIIVLKSGERIPAELTLISRKNGDKEKRHMEKKRNHREGKILLLWPNKFFSKEMVKMGFGRKKAQKAALQWLKEAAEGGYEARRTFRHWLRELIQEFLERQASN